MGGIGVGLQTDEAGRHLGGWFALHGTRDVRALQRDLVCGGDVLDGEQVLGEIESDGDNEH